MKGDSTLLAMIHKPPKGLFVTGVDTEIGKTYVTCLIARQLRAEGRRVGVYKPAASGAEQREGMAFWRDPHSLWEAAGRPGDLARVCPQTFAAPLAPHLAARKEGREIDPDLLRRGLEAWKDDCEIVIVEGAGGLMAPMGDEDYVADLAYEFGYPLVVVAANRLGVINHTLQTLVTAAAFGEGIPIAGVVLNSITEEGDLSSDSNSQQLRARCGCPVLAEVSYNSSRFSPSVDWWNLAQPEQL